MTCENRISFMLSVIMVKVGTAVCNATLRIFSLANIRFINRGEPTAKRIPYGKLGNEGTYS